MAQETLQQKRLIGERVRALATVYLTRRPEVIVHDSEGESGLDFLVSLDSEDRSGLRQFGVEAKGGWSKIRPAGKPNANLRPAMQGLLRFGPFPFPVALFFFTMEDEEGWYTWVAEPVVTDDGGYKLLQHDKASCLPLNDGAVDEIIARVDCWYDAFFARTAIARG